MELTNPSTREYKGDVLVTDNPFEEQPIVTTVTIRVDEYDQRTLNLISHDRKELVKKFINAYGRAKLDSLLGILNDIERCIFTIMAYQRCTLISTSNLSAAVDRLSGDITVDLLSLVVSAEAKLAERARSISVVPLHLVTYTDVVLRYTLYSVSYTLRYKDILLKMADGLRPDTN